MAHKHNREIGHSPLDCVDPIRLSRTVGVVGQLIRRFSAAEAGGWVLVAGAGHGEEADLIHRMLGRPTIGVDLNIRRPGAGASAPFANRQRHDLHALAFRDAAFGVVYSYHALEHVTSPVQVLREFARVLAPGGLLFIGFPNKSRAFAYIGTSQRASWTEKLAWNLNDYRFRFRGKFDNRFGAHAGFTEREFLGLCAGLFDEVHPVRSDYQLVKYPRLRPFIRLMIATGIDDFLFPANYFVCRRPVNRALMRNRAALGFA